MYRQYDAVICISDKAKDNLTTHINNERGIVTINNGIDYQIFASRIKTTLPDIKTIIMVASMRDAKDQDTVIRAMTLLGNKYRLKLVGDGPRRIALEQLSNELKCSENIEFMGNQSDIPSLLETSDVVVLSSHWEGLSLASIEGMASGRPFIASDVQGLSEWVKDYGILFPHGDDLALAKAIKALCENPNYYRSVAVRCQQRAKQFDISETAKKYNDLYHSL